MKIVRATEKDLATVQHLNHELFIYERAHGFYAGDSYTLDWPLEEAGTKYFRDRLTDKTSAVFLAIQDGTAVGYICGSYEKKAYRNQNPVAEVENMFVAESVRHQGVGRQLVQTFTVWAKENKVAYLRVAAFAKNDKALSFYHDCGFFDSEIHLEQAL
jgi:GNAT superfamily N-acetyltransferase